MSFQNNQHKGTNYHQKLLTSYNYERQFGGEATLPSQDQTGLNMKFSLFKP